MYGERKFLVSGSLGRLTVREIPLSLNRELRFSTRTIEHWHDTLGLKSFGGLAAKEIPLIIEPHNTIFYQNDCWHDRLGMKSTSNQIR